MDNQIKEMAKIIVNELKIDKYWALVISETLVNAGYGDLRAFAETLKAKMPCEEVFKGIWEKIDETLNEFLGE